MKKIIKRLIIGSGIFFILIVISLIIFSKFIKVEKYKPYIENKVSREIGLPLKLNGDLSFSLFPWAGISFTDLSIGNPPGFREKNLLTIKSFKVKMKLLPLLSKKIEVKEFVVEEPCLFLEKQKNGKGNWEGIGEKKDKIPSYKIVSKGNNKKIEKKSDKDEFPIKSIFVKKIEVKNGFVQYNDDTNGDKKNISDLSFNTDNVSLDKPVDFDFAAKINGYLMSIKGKAGEFSKQTKQFPIDLNIKFAKLININIKGKISDPLKKKQFDLKLNISPFSPKKLIKLTGIPLTIITSDPSALTSMDFNAGIKGDPENISVSKGVINIDKSKVDFSADIKKFSKPDITFNFNMDSIDIDKYLPAFEKSDTEKVTVIKEKTEIQENSKKQINYAPLRKLVINGKINVGKIKVHGGNIEKLYVKIYGKNGIFNIKPVSFNMYNGSVLSDFKLNVVTNTPKTFINIKADKINAGLMLNDFMKKNIIEGTLKSIISLNMKGDSVEKIKKNLNGNGDFVFTDGAVVGVDIPGMIHNLKVSIGLAEKNKTKQRTDFSELHSPFTIKNGIFDTSGTTMTSPVLRVKIKGKADLNKENLNFRVEPKFVATLKGQGDTKKRSGIILPILVKGSFDYPKFKPDYKGILRENFGKSLPKKDDLKNLIKGKGSSSIKFESIKKSAGGLINSFLSGSKGTSKK